METQEIVGNFLKYFGLNPKSFAQKAGINPQILYDIQRGRTKNITKDTAEKIVEAFPELNIVWLLTGEGPMLKQEGGPNVMANGDNNKIAGHDINECTKLEALYEARISDLQDRVSHQRAIIDSLTRTLEAMANK